MNIMNTESRYFAACASGDLEEVKEIIGSNKVPVDVRSPEGWTGLIISCFNQNLEIVKFLIENKADVNATNAKGTSVFMYAKTAIQQNQDQTQILDLLLEKGADINHLDCFDKSVLDYVIENGALELAKWLEEKGAKHGDAINRN